MKKKHHMSVLCLGLLLAACAPKAPKFRLSGYIDNMKTGKVFIYNEDDVNAFLDTIFIENSRFTVEAVSEGVTPFYLVFPNAVEQVIFAEGGKSLHYEASLNDLKNYTVDGSEANEIMNEFRKQVSHTSEEAEIRSVAMQFIKTYPDSPVAVYLLDRYFVRVDRIDLARLTSLFKAVKTVQPDNEYIQSLEGKLKMLGSGRKGKVLPSVRMETSGKDSLNIKDYKNGYELIYFWATWMRNVDDVIGKVGEFYEKYGKKHDIKVVSVSLDGSKYQWQEFVRYDTVHTVHLYDGLAWDSPAVRKLGVASLPFFVLADKNKKITATGSNLDALQDGLEPTTP
ncbi:MAG: DUF4369 domain-containing protein [Bacteroidaceae bacterium]|nr:DUF4369 domain-containing protein [Bacteroidaceae bacterium]